MKSNRTGTVGTRAIDWEEYKTKEGRAYFFNKVTQKRTWTKPQVLVEHEYSTRSKCFWKEYFDKQRNRHYYFNEETGESVWTKPEELAQYEKRQASIQNNEVTQKLNIEQFNILLEEACTDSTEDWPTVQKRMVNDERYKSIDSIELKKDLFYRFLSVLRRRESDARKKIDEKYKARFLELLKEVEGQVRFLSFPSYLNTVEPLLLKLPNNEVLNKLSGFSKLDHYDEFLVTYERDSRKNETAAKARLKKELYNIFMMKHKQGFLTPRTVWRDFQKSDHLMKNQEYLKIVKSTNQAKTTIFFNPKKKTVLSSFEVLQVWSDFMRDLEDETRRNAKRELERQHLERRNNRIKFWKTLSQLEKSSQFDVDSEWKKDVQKLVEDTDEYKTILKSRNEMYRKVEEENFFPTSDIEIFTRKSSSSSYSSSSSSRSRSSSSRRIVPPPSLNKKMINRNHRYNDEKVEILGKFMNDHVDCMIGPKELFYEFVDEMEITYQRDCKEIKSVMESNNIKIELNTSSEEFSKKIIEAVQMKEDHIIKDIRNIEIYHKHAIVRQKKKLIRKLKNDILKSHREEVLKNERILKFIEVISAIPSSQNDEQMRIFKEEINPFFEEEYLQKVYERFQIKYKKRQERRLKKKRKREEQEQQQGEENKNNIIKVNNDLFPVSKKRKIDDDNDRRNNNTTTNNRRIYDPFEDELNRYKRLKRKF